MVCDNVTISVKRQLLIVGAQIGLVTRGLTRGRLGEDDVGRVPAHISSLILSQELPARVVYSLSNISWREILRLFEVSVVFPGVAVLRPRGNRSTASAVDLYFCSIVPDASAVSARSGGTDSWFSAASHGFIGPQIPVYSSQFYIHPKTPRSNSNHLSERWLGLVFSVFYKR